MANDPFFSSGPDANWNACIGQQGNEESYADGFIQAALELTASLFEKKQYDKRDTLVYPILYTARHGIELSLKLAIHRLVEFGILSHDHVKNHDIMSHWQYLRTARLGDEYLRQVLAEIEPYVVSLSQIDEDGQELRYHENREGQQSLANHGITSLIVISVSLVKLSEVLSKLKCRLLELREERSAGFFTLDCSRRDLINIAALLPPISDWDSDNFTFAKEFIKKRYDLGSNKFSDVLKLLKSGRETKQILGQETPLVHLSDERAIYVAAGFLKQYPPRHDDGPTEISIGSLDFESIFADQPREVALYKELLANLSLEEIADVCIIYYLGRNGELSETYEERIQQEVAGLKRSGRGDDEFIHVFTKTNFAREFENGLRRLGKASLAEEVARMSQQ